MSRVVVLLSTYNGEKYVKTQIDSVLAQQNVEVVLYVRDDGSKDQTQNILKQYSDNGKLVWYTGSNLGAAKKLL